MFALCTLVDGLIESDYLHRITVAGRLDIETAWLVRKVDAWPEARNVEAPRTLRNLAIGEGLLPEAHSEALLATCQLKELRERSPRPVEQKRCLGLLLCSGIVE